MLQILIVLNIVNFIESANLVQLNCECNNRSKCYTTKVFPNLIDEDSKFLIENCEKFNFDEIEELQLSWMMDGIKRNLTEFKNLKVLKISKSNLVKNFKINLEDLKILHLSGNKIKNYSEFFNTSKIEEIYLNKNEISLIKNLKNHKNLKFLNLESNKIFYASFNAFFGLPELFHLNLNHNELTSLESLTFSKNLKLAELNLNWNRLIFLHDHQFSSNSNLKVLRLRGNFLRIIKRVFFINNFNLENIDMADNKIKFIQSKIFRNSLNLQFVDLRENQCIYEWFYVPKNRDGMEKLIQWSCHEMSGINFIESDENEEL